MQKNYSRFKKLKTKTIKKRKAKKKWKKKEKKGKPHRTAKSNVDAEVYNNNKKCD